MRGREDPKDPAVSGYEREQSINKGRVVLRLYVTGAAPNSTQAIANITQICEGYESEAIDLEIVDILEEPLRALSDSIIVSPTLVKVSPPPKRVIIGTLIERERVIEVLGLGEAIDD